MSPESLLDAIEANRWTVYEACVDGHNSTETQWVVESEDRPIATGGTLRSALIAAAAPDLLDVAKLAANAHCLGPVELQTLASMACAAVRRTLEHQT